MLQQALAIETAEREAAIARGLDGDLRRTVTYLDPKEVYQRRFRAFARTLLAGPLTPERLVEVTRAAERRGVMGFVPYLFNASGVLINPPNMRSREAAVVQVMWALTRNTAQAGHDFYQLNKATLRNVVGNDLRFDDLRARRGSVLQVPVGRSERLIFWDAPKTKDHSGLLLIQWQLSSVETMFARLARRPGHQRLALLGAVRGQPLHVAWAAKGLATATIDALAHAERVRGLFSDRDWFWLNGTAGSMRLVIGCRRAGFDPVRVERAIWVGAVFLALLVGVIGGRRWQRGGTFGLSIRARLMVLFVFAVALPMLGLGVLSGRTLRDREAVLAAETMKGAKDVLDGLDFDMTRERKRFLSLCRQFRDRPEMRTNPSDLSPVALAMEHGDKLNWLEVRDIRGRILATTEDARVTQRIGPVAAVFSKMCIERHLGDRLPPTEEEKMPDQVEMILRGAIESPAMGFSRIMDRPDQIHEFQFGGYDLYWYWDVLHDPTHPVAFMECNQRLDRAIRAYLNTALRARHGMGQGAFRLFARRAATNMWFPEGVAEPVPCVPLENRARITGQVVTDRIYWQGRSYLAMAMPGRNLKGHVAVALYPFDEITRPISLIRRDLLGGMALALMAALLIGAALADTFLKPLGELTGGIVALHRRDTSVRLRPYQRDELGDLALLFNRMIDEVKEMLLARSIQESLIPRQAPDWPGYEVEIVNISAADLGGDYVDAVPTCDGRALLVLGDVTGHGVSAALLTAMAKAVVFRFAEEGGELLALMDRLNRMISKLIRRRKRMTLLAGLLDVQSHVLTLSDAGHPFPLVVRADGRVDELEIVHAPLGSSARWGSFEQHTTSLAPGDTLLMYTDGLVEAQNPGHEMYSIDRLRTFASTLAGKSTGEIGRILVAEWENHRAGVEPDDDLSFLIARRLPLSAPETANG